jgi:cation transport regulator ChaB
MPARKELPSTLRRSPRDAQETWIRTHDSAVQTYGEGQRAHRVAYASLKHEYEKVGDHWERKPEPGPSDREAARGYPRTRARPRQTAGGVDATAPREHLYEVARRLGIRGRGKMTKSQLVEAIERENTRETAASRKD